MALPRLQKARPKSALNDRIYSGAMTLRSKASLACVCSQEMGPTWRDDLFAFGSPRLHKLDFLSKWAPTSELRNSNQSSNYLNHLVIQ